MPTPALFPRNGPRAAAFRGFVTWLRDSPALRGTVKTWVVWDGSDSAGGRQPAEENLPWVRLTPETPGASAAAFQAGRRLQETAIDVRIQTAVAGTNWDDSANLWDAIEARIYPQDGVTLAAMEAYLRPLGILEVLPLTTGTTVQDPPATDVATGKVRLSLILPA